MNRAQTRLSRGLVGLLLITLVLGAAVALHQSEKNKKAVASNSLVPTTNPVVAAPTTAPSQAQARTTMPSVAAQHRAEDNSTALIAGGPALSGKEAPAANVVISQTPTAAPPTTQPQVEAKAPTPDTSAEVKLASWTPGATAVPAAPSAGFLNDASTKTAAGDLLGARKILNDALLSGHLSPADMDATRKQLGAVNDTLLFSTRKFPDDEFGGVHVVTERTLSKVADKYDVPWQLIARINGLSDPRKMQANAKLKVIKGPFNIVVYKKAFRMDLYLGGTPEKPGSLFVRSFPVGLGRDDSTPTGTWLVEMNHKTKDPVYYSPRGEGVIAANDPKNPLGHRWIGLTGIDGQAVGQQSYGIHGTIEPDSIGKQASMGCIRMRNEDVEQVFDMVAEGKTTVIVKD